MHGEEHLEDDRKNAAEQQVGLFELVAGDWKVLFLPPENTRHSWGEQPNTADKWWRLLMCKCWSLRGTNSDATRTIHLRPVSDLIKDETTFEIYELLHKHWSHIIFTMLFPVCSCWQIGSVFSSFQWYTNSPLKKNPKKQKRIKLAN